MPIFFSSTCFWLSGAAQHRLGFLNITSGSTWKFRKPNPTMLLRTVCLSMRPDMACLCVEVSSSNATYTRGTKNEAYYAGDNVTRRVFKNKMAALSAVSEKKKNSPAVNCICCYFQTPSVVHCMNATASAQSPKFSRNFYPQTIFANFCG